MNIEITPTELKQQLDSGVDVFILDVREPVEYEAANIGGTLIPLMQLPHRCGELDSSRATVVHCHHGGRSMQAVQFLMQRGFTNVKNLAGGIDRWSLEVDPSVRRY